MGKTTSSSSDSLSAGRSEYQQEYGDLSGLNTSGLILRSIGTATLEEVVHSYLDLLETSSAIYEADGSYAIGIFSSGWCRFLDVASRRLAGTKDNREALASGKWLCHESCWQDCARLAIETGAPVDIECRGGLRLYACPIKTGEQSIGAINFGYGDPPTGQRKLAELAQRYDVGVEELAVQAKAYRSRSPEVIEAAKRQLTTSARLLGEMVLRHRVEQQLRVDIAERKKREAQLEASERQFRIIFESDMIGTGFWGEGGKLYRVNDAYLKLIQRTRDDLEQDRINWREITPPEHHSVDDRALKQILESGTCTPYEKEYARPDGTRVPVMIGGAMVQRSPLIGVAYALDISTLKAVESRLIENEFSLNKAQRIARIGHFKFDPNAGVVEGSDELFRIFGLSRDEFQFSDFMNAVRSDQREFVTGTIANAIEQKSGYAIEHYLKLRDGTMRYIRANGDSTLDANGEVAFLMGTVQDITERKREQDELQKTQKLESLGQLAGGIAHDFNNLLGGMLGNIDLARDDLDPSSQAMKHLNLAIGAFDRAKDLTMQLLTFSKGGAPFKTVISLGPTLDESRALALSGSRIRCRMDLSADLHPIEADAGQLTQVMNNLLLNARQAMPTGGLVTVSAKNRRIEANQVCGLPAGDYVQISVADEGMGIPESLLSQVFDPFFTTRGSGSGLGLATAHSIMRRHEGAITLESRIGKGTTVRLFLPAGRVATAPLSDSMPQRIKMEGRVLVMDDEEMMRNVAQGLLELLGFDVVCAGDGEQAIAVFKEQLNAGNRFDLVLLDLTVPGGVGGDQAMSEMLKLDSRISGIVASGYADSAILSNPEAYGFSGKIEKPFRKAELARVIQTVLESR